MAADAFGETIAEGYRSVYDGKPVWSGRSEFQKIEIFDNPTFGRTLVLDGLVQTTERDEFTYHEMLVHPALSALGSVSNVCIIGGGDGGTLRHVLMHGVESVTMCEIDAEVVRVCREFMPALSDGAFDDPRADVLFADGADFVSHHADTFDAIIVDGSDAVGPAAILFSTGFYEGCRQALKPGGVFVSQTGSPLFQEDEFRLAYGNLSAVFDTVEPYLSFVPTYPGTLWSYMAATSGHSVARAQLADRGLSTKLYTHDVHRGAFALPPFVQEICETTTPAAVPGR